jgi:hypothetical protein
MQPERGDLHRNVCRPPDSAKFEEEIHVHGMPQFFIEAAYLLNAGCPEERPLLGDKVLSDS